LINTGEFNIIVLPEARQYFILSDSDAGVERLFVRGADIAYEDLKPLWFEYRPDETWKDFDGKPHHLGVDLEEDELVGMYALKKFNFGGLVAVRDSEERTVKVFKRDKMSSGMSSRTS
jgi:hypothetical protein